MAEQARKVGGRIAELRNGRGWKGKHLVARMAELGDQSLNTNQLSRYENGGAMPGETRLSRFASALETTVDDLHAGPVAERKEPKRGDLAALNGNKELEAIRRQLSRLEKDLRELRGIARQWKAERDAAFARQEITQEHPQEIDQPGEEPGTATQS